MLYLVSQFAIISDIDIFVFLNILTNCDSFPASIITCFNIDNKLPFTCFLIGALQWVVSNFFYSRLMEKSVDIIFTIYILYYCVNWKWVPVFWGSVRNLLVLFFSMSFFPCGVKIKTKMKCKKS